MTREQIKARIAELVAMPAECIQTDSGTHSKPAIHRVYEAITGETYATRSFAGANETTIPVADVAARTDGRVRDLVDNWERIRAAQAELKGLRKQLAKM